MSKVKIPGNLSFRKRLEPSKGILFGTSWDKRREICVPLTNELITVRGGKTHHQNFPDNREKGESELGDANIHTLDSCLLSKDHDTVRLTYTLKVLNGVAGMESCNDKEFLNLFEECLKEKLDTVGVKVLAHRYATNIANGRPLWKNREATHIETVVRCRGSETEWVFDGKEIPLHTFDYESSALTGLTQVIEDALLGNTDLIILEVSSYALVGQGQPVFPSQEFIQDQGNGFSSKKDGKKSKVLYFPEDVAGLHPQKIGNAIRTIDSWYGDGVSPIAVEPYGAQPTFNTHHRSPYEQKDFYSMLVKFVNKEELTESEVHYFMAMLVKGGVFGAAKSKPKPKSK